MKRIKQLAGAILVIVVFFSMSIYEMCIRDRYIGMSFAISARSS